MHDAQGCSVLSRCAESPAPEHFGYRSGSENAWKAGHCFAVNHQRSQIALLFFNKKVNDVVDFSQGNSAVSDKLRQVDKDPANAKGLAKGGTAFRDAILQGVQLLDHPGSSDALYLLTDAQDNASTHSASDVNHSLAFTSVRLFAVLLQDERTLTVPGEWSPGPDQLSEIARKSGGEILSAASWHAGSITLSANSEAKVKTQETLTRLYQTILQDSLLEIEPPFRSRKMSGGN